MPCLLPSMSMSEKSVCGLNETERDGGERAQGASQGPCPHGREGQKEGSWGRGLGRRRAQIFIHIDAATQRLGRGTPAGSLI